MGGGERKGKPGFLAQIGFLLDWNARNYNRPQMRRVLLVVGLGGVAVSVLVMVALVIWLRARGGAGKDEVVYWLRIATVILLGVVLVGPLLVWAATGFNFYRFAPARALVPALGVPIGILLGGRQAQLTFYEVAAQVIPVLLLVLAVEFRAFLLRRADALPDGEELYKLCAGLVVLTMMAGEGMALSAIAVPEADIPDYAPCVVTSAVATGFLATLMYSVWGNPSSSAGERR